jgi:hypothetical protein
LATSGARKQPSFSKVRRLPFQKFHHSDIIVDVCGKLEGERLVGSSIEGKPNLRYCVEPPTSANAMDWKSLQDWRDPIHRLLKSPDRDVSNIHISMEQSGSPKSRRVRSLKSHLPFMLIMA